MPRPPSASSPSSAIASELVEASSQALRSVPSRRAAQEDTRQKLVRREFTLPQMIDDFFAYELMRQAHAATGHHVSRSELLRAVLLHVMESQQSLMPAIVRQLNLS